MTSIYDKKETTFISKKCEKNKMMDTNDEKQTTPRITLRSKVGSNDICTTPSKISLCNTSSQTSWVTI
jgi:hypothetical protein